jgi:hypothetical protein
MYAPLPFFLPVRSIESSPSGDFTTLTSSRLGFDSPQPVHFLKGCFFTGMISPFKAQVTK